MKINYNLITLSLLGFMAACQPVEDIYNEIDDKGTTITKTEDEYILTAADYESISKAAKANAKSKEDSTLADAVKSRNALNSFATADKYVPQILANLYPSWGKDSNVGVTYNMYEEPEGLVKELSNISIYQLSADDYKLIWGEDEYKVNYLTPNREPSEVLPEFLKRKNATAEENEMILIDYKYDTEEPKESPSIFLEDFSSVSIDADIALEGWKNIAVEGTKKWIGKEFSGNAYAQMSAYGSGGKAENWLITPAVNIYDANAKFSFSVAFGYHNGDALKVYVSDKYDGGDNVNTADWTEITSEFNFPEPISGGYTDMTNAGEYALSAYKDKNVYFAFAYTGEDGKVTTTVQIDNVRVSSSAPAQSNEKPYSMLFTFKNGSWEVYQNDEVALVTPADYDEMGAPGSHDNFSDTDKFEDYVPAFLAKKYPFAQSGDTKVVIFKYYSNKTTVVRAERFNYETSWIYFNNIVVRSKETFIHNGSQWLFDPSIHVMMDTNDYKLLVEWVQENKPGYMDPKYDNTEYWFGASYHYNNFNVQIIKRRGYDPDKVVPADDAAAKEFLDKQILEGIKILMPAKYPDAPSQMNGVDLYYYLSCKVYDGGGNYKYTYKIKSLGNGEFDYENAAPVIVNW